MPQVRNRKLPVAFGRCSGEFETARVHWKKGANPSGLVASDWLLVPLPSDLMPGEHRLSLQQVAELAAVVRALDSLRTWLTEQRTPFSVESAVAACFSIASTSLTSDIQAGFRQILEDLGCTPSEKQTAASRSWYMPPLHRALRASIGRDPPSTGMQDRKGYPLDPPQAIYRMGTVIKLSGLSRSSIYRLESISLFPSRIKLSGSAVGWRSDEIHSWIASRKAMARGAK